MEFEVVIEIPKSQRNKCEMDHETRRIRLDVRPDAGHFYPVPGTATASSSTRWPTTVTRSVRW